MSVQDLVAVRRISSITAPTRAPSRYSVTYFIIAIGNCKTLVGWPCRNYFIVRIRRLLLQCRDVLKQSQCLLRFRFTQEIDREPHVNDAVVTDLRLRDIVQADLAQDPAEV